MNVTDIPRSDILNLLSNYDYSPSDDIYSILWDIISSGTIGSAPLPIVDWIVAYNLLSDYDSITLDLPELSDLSDDRINRIFFYLHKSNLSLTHIKEIDMKILLGLDDPSLTKICQSSRYINSLCNNNDFWRLKIEKLYDNFPIPLEYHNNIKELYQKILTLADLIYLTLSKGWIDVWVYIESLELFKWLISQNYFDIETYHYHWANMAAKDGQLKMVKWFISRGIFPNKGGANLAASNNHLDILKLLVLHNILPDYTAANMAAMEGYLDILRWLVNYDILPNVEGANWASQNGKLEVLSWLAFPRKSCCE